MFFLSVKAFPRQDDMWPFHSWKDWAIGIGINFVIVGLAALLVWLS